MTVWPVTCPHCGVKAFLPTNYVNRAERECRKIYCSRECSGLGRRIERTKADKVAAKAAYDAEYRAKNREMLKAKKHEYFKATYDPIKAAEERKLKMPKHVEYCRRPEYKKWKVQYDRKYRATKDFGSFGEAAIVLYDLQSEILSRASRYEIDLASGTLNKKLQRRRDYDKAFSR